MSANFRLIFWASNYQKTVDFYREMLECPLLHDWDNGPGKKGTVVSLGSGEIEILEASEGKDIIQPKGFEISIDVPDVNKHYDYLKNKGVSIRGELADKPWGARTFSVNDPDGMKLIFSTPLKK